MPWKPRYTREEARAAIERSETWAEVLHQLGCVYHGKNIQTLRKWAGRWNIDISHLPVGVAGVRHKYSEAEVRRAIAGSRSWAESLRRLGRCHTGGNPATLKKRAAEWKISTAHFDPHAASNEALKRRTKIPLEEILIRGSTYSRSNLKARLYAEGLKRRVCELCGQGEVWRGNRIGLILDHVNGIRDDNRLENLRIVCPNCAATLATHCGRKNRVEIQSRECLRCGSFFLPRHPRQRFCSRYCGTRSLAGSTRRGIRKVERPPETRLLLEVEEHGYLGVGRRYGVSDNAVRKWLREYAREQAIAEGRDPALVEIPRRTWPNMKKAA